MDFMLAAQPTRPSLLNACCLALLLGGLGLPGLALAQDDSAPPASAATAPDQRQAGRPFRLEIIAPAPLDAFLLRHAELQRFSQFTDLSRAELERLLLTAPADLRGTAFGFFNLVSGVAMLLASVLAGLLWDRLGAAFTFYAGAAFCAMALAGLLLRGRGPAAP